MRPLLLAVALGLAVLPAATATTCAPFFVGAACAGVVVGTGASADAFLYLAPLQDWRSAHVAAGPGGAGVAANGYGPATAGTLSVWAGASTAGPFAGAYFCVGAAPYAPPSCGDPVTHATRLVPTLP